ncbi:ATP-binding cassette domain-containing protein [Nocardia yunnanensis]|uniref:ATP-binding cassette domain-containing protein n=1 Tax=Nocardia yunnanensis TaxID=2382165 RepID=A0A386ZGK1_9NOCA|nr:ATP-binding cassette domain-containing protein [Nocardia yunnanensis]AYF76731.1 ATP-binding cassette domain-containing protein [Nocardia yunnanensis]
MIQARGLGKRYGDVPAVDNLSFDVRPGVVTGFLGPNGAGKSTTMRLMLGLDHGSGRTLFDGQTHAELADPLRSVGVMLDARSVHPTRTAIGHLRMIAAGAGIGERRVEEVLGLVGLCDVAGKRAGGFSLGMRQRLGLAAALLGDPATLILDEPANGLDPEGVRWLRDLLKGLARQGRSVFVSSHLLNEMAHLADSLIVIGAGRLLAAESVADFVQRNSAPRLVARTDRPQALAEMLSRNGFQVRIQPDGAVVADGDDRQRVAVLAMQAGLLVTELTQERTSLEEAYFHATADATQYRGHIAA